MLLQLSIGAGHEPARATPKWRVAGADRARHHGGMDGKEVGPEKQFAFPRLYRLWKGHDLATHDEGLESIRPWFYEGLRPESEPLVWRFIEENYLLKYGDIMAVRFDWASSGLWQIPFPGSVSDTYNIGGLDAMGVPERVRRLLREWHDPHDARPYDPEEDEDFDYEASNARGLAAAKEMKRFLGDEVYLEFRLFQEIYLVDGEPEELGVPEFILGFAEGAR